MAAISPALFGLKTFNVMDEGCAPSTFPPAIYTEIYFTCDVRVILGLASFPFNKIVLPNFA